MSELGRRQPRLACHLVEEAGHWVHVDSADALVSLLTRAFASARAMVISARMGLKDTLKWARTEWGIFRKGGEMGWNQRAQWVRQWVPFGTRTVGLGDGIGGHRAVYRGAHIDLVRKEVESVERARLKIFIEATGQENVPDGGFVYASNHESLVDILVLGAALPATSSGPRNAP